MSSLKDRCKHCKRERGKHKATTHHCPVGMKTRIGYLQFHPTQVFELGKEYKNTITL